MVRVSGFLFLILKITLQVLLLSEGSWASPDRVMNITNDLDESIPLTIHCQSKDNDLGEHELQYHTSLHWQFKSNPFPPFTVFWCSMSWQTINNGTFDVYKASRDDTRCAQYCMWKIRQTGAYSFDEGKQRWDLMYIW